jgi:hypothetical protein
MAQEVRDFLHCVSTKVNECYRHCYRSLYPKKKKNKDVLRNDYVANATHERVSASALCLSR